jgi:maltose/maltodextrin transport system substrate-binding protein/arabinogalactan oligomer/maltooligosaccharide transport system substrate-binding protein
MKLKRLLTLITLLLLAAFVLAACGSDEAEVPADEPAAAESSDESAVEETPAEEMTEEEVAEVEEPAEEEEPVEEAAATESDLTLTIWVDEKQFDVIDGMVDELQNEYGATLIVQQFGFGDLQNQFLIAAPAGEGPDVLVTAHNTLGEVVTNGLLAPIDLGDAAADYAPAAIQAWQYNGELYGLPYSTENVGFFINQDIVEECPTTWTEVMEISRELSADNDDDIATNKYGFVGIESDPYHFFPIMTAFDGYVFGLTDQGYDPTDVGVDSEGSLAAATFWDEYIKEGLQPAGADPVVIMDLFESEQSAMTITGPWNTQRVQESGVNYAICPIPGEVNETGQPFMGSFGFAINSFSENPLLAEIFVKEFLGREETMRALYEATPQVPAHLSVLENLDDPDLVAFGVAGENALAMPAIPEMNSVWEAWGNAVTLVSQQGDDPVNAFSNAADQIRTAISGEGEETSDEEAASPVEFEMVNIPGTAQVAMGCDGDWDPACEASALTLDDNGLWTGTFEIPAGDYEVKVAINGGWDINYGVDGLHNGANFTYSLAEDSTVTFNFDPETNLLEIVPE